MRDKCNKLITIRKMADSKFRFNSLLYGVGGGNFNSDYINGDWWQQRSNDNAD